MRVAFLTDVHGNLAALEAVLAHARAAGVDEIWNGGDMVGYGPQPEECVCCLREQAALSIAGNYDQRVLLVPERRERWRHTKHPLKLLAFTYAWDSLSPASRDWLGGLPTVVRRDILGTVVQVNHASPASDREHLGPQTPAGRWRHLAELARADLILAGHTHLPWTHRDGRTRFVNPGAVGRPEGGDPRAGYALIDFAVAGVDVTLHRVVYDTEATAAAIQARQLPTEFAQMFRRGLPLGDVLGGGSPVNPA
jgi:predicted phosphodiesterase